ncbi:MAG TPA: hypothetical protein VHY31_23635 [Streptosporangiaceae bacterium]|jgi:hypothetical protein|nr:hypothetical protein [Streptosporangiaceae bacterium]
MDRLAQEDIVAAAAAHRDLGRDYDDAVAEGLVERIGAEIDKRIDARLNQPAPPPRRRGRLRPTSQPGPPSAPGQPGRSGWEVVPLALGSMLIAAITSASMVNSGHASGAEVALIWLVIAVINVAYARRR